MESKLPVIAKKFWHMVRVALFMLRKGISKSKILADFNMMMKRGKIAGKAIHNLMFHHRHHWAAPSATSATTSASGRSLDEYEFSCSNSPAFRLPFHLNKRKNNNHHHQFEPPMEDEFTYENAVKTLEMMQIQKAASPALPGFGRSPVVRQLRITDSPFPLSDGDEDEEDSRHVDEAAEKFIAKFYKDLRRQHAIAA